MANFPRIENAPGLVWRKHKTKITAQWQARRDAAAKGFRPTGQRIWSGVEPSELELSLIADTCQRLQQDMRMWLKGGPPLPVTRFDGTLAGLIDCYRDDIDSRYQKLRFRTRRGYNSFLRRLVEQKGKVRLEDVDSRTLLRWHEEWCEDGHIAQAHSFIGILRSLLTYGRTLMEKDDRALGSHCVRLGLLLHDMKFQAPSARLTAITSQQVVAFRAQAHAMGHHSLALAQALQFELLLRQKDVIGEWVPLDERGMSDVIHNEVEHGQLKWTRGLRWEEISDSLILRHTTSKRGKVLEVDLNAAPMVLEELQRFAASGAEMTGPVVVREKTGIPWRDHDYRRYWRMVADCCGIPREVFNMDSRAGGITEATDAGAELEHVRHAATHSDIKMTQRYSRGSTDKIAKVLQIRTAYRNKNSSGSK